MHVIATVPNIQYGEQYRFLDHTNENSAKSPNEQIGRFSVTSLNIKLLAASRLVLQL